MATPTSARRSSLRPPTPQDIYSSAKREVALGESASAGRLSARSDRSDNSPSTRERRSSLSKLAPIRRMSSGGSDLSRADKHPTGGRRTKSRPPSRQLPEPRYPTGNGTPATPGTQNAGGGGGGGGGGAQGAGGIGRRPSFARNAAPPARPVPATPHDAKPMGHFNDGGARATPKRPGSSNPFSNANASGGRSQQRRASANPWSSGARNKAVEPAGSVSTSNPFSTKAATKRDKAVDDRVRRYEAAVAARGKRAASRQGGQQSSMATHADEEASSQAAVAQAALVPQPGGADAAVQLERRGSGVGTGAGPAGAGRGPRPSDSREQARRKSTDKQDHPIMGMGGMLKAATLTGSLAETGTLLLQSTISKFPMFWKRGLLLGAGTFGKVYRGLNVLTGELFAVKQIPSQGPCGDLSQGLDTLAREVDLMRELRHENIVRYLGTEREEGTLYVFLEYVPGGSIASLLREFGTLDEPLVAVYTRQILEGINYLHGRHIIHRDIKGANILVNELGICKLADFGASRQLDGSQTRQLEASLKAIRGTVPFMAPEVIKQTGHGLPADVWSLGATVIEMATGSPPWSEFSTNLAMMFHVGTTTTVPKFPEKLSDVAHDFLDKCMRMDPKERLTAAELLKHPFVKNASRANIPSRYALAGLGRGSAR